jgi:hypothetical protein
MFFEIKGQNTDEIKDESWLQDLDFAVDITAQLTDLNLKLQGKNKIITRWDSNTRSQQASARRPTP